MLNFLATDQARRVRAQQLAHVRRDDRRVIDDRITERLAHLFVARRNPARGHSERRIFRRFAFERGRTTTRIDREQTPIFQASRADLGSEEHQAIAARRELEIVANMNRRNHHAEIFRELFAQASRRVRAAFRCAPDRRPKPIRNRARARACRW